MRPPLPLLRALGLCLLLGTAAPVASAGDAAVAAARVVQEELPSLQARRQTADARSDAGRRWFAGRAQLSEAFVDLAGAPLDAPGYVDGALAALDQRAVERAGWRIASPPPGLDEQLAGQWRDARDGVAAAEDEADDLQRRFLVSVRAVLTRAPDLQAGATADVRARWAAALSTIPPEGDPGRPAALQAAAEAGDAAAALDRTLAAVWRVACIPDDPALTTLVDADLAAAADAPSDALLDRLSRVRPLLDPDRQAAVEALLSAAELARLRAAVPDARAALQALKAQVDAPPVPGVGVDALQQRVADLDAAAAEAEPLAAPADDAPEVERLRAELAGIEHDRLEAERALLRRQIEIAQRDAAATASAAHEEQARRRATEARAAAEQADNDQQAAARAQLAQFEEDLAGWIQAERDRHAASAQQLTDCAARLADVQTAAAEAADRPVLDVGRQDAIDAAYRSARRLVLELRKSLSDADQLLAGLDDLHAERRARLPDRDLIGDDGDLALADLADLHDQQRVNASSELDQVVELLGGSKKVRRRLRGQASTSASAEMRSAFLPELLKELSEAPLVVRADLRATWRAVLALPARVTDLNAIAAFLLQSIEIVVLGILWVLLRRNAEDMGRRLLAVLWKQQQDGVGALTARRLAQVEWFVPGDARALAAPLAPVLFAAVDASIAWFFFDLTRDGLTLLALFFFGWLARTTWRGAPAVVNLLFAPPDARRPALRLVAPQAIALLERSVRLVVGLVLWVYFFNLLALDLFDADRLADIVAVFRTVGTIVVACWLLLLWADEVRLAVGGLGGLEGPAARLMDQGGGFPVRLLRSAAGVGWLVWRGAAELVVRVAEGRPGLGWLASAFARARLRKAGDSPVERRPIAEDARAALTGTALPIPRDAELATLDDALTAWSLEDRRGMIAVVGDRGMGREQVIQQAVDRALELEEGLAVRHLALAGRTHDPDHALVWLARSLDLPDVGVTEEGLIEALIGMPRTIFVIDELQRLALRAVGGFGAVHVVLRVMQACSEEHLWICGVHGATWGYLAGVTSSVNLEAFRCAVVLEGLSAAVLGDWVTRRVQAAGYRLRFDDLLPAGAALADREQAVARAERAYWRLLVDASKGNPEIAWTYVLGSLCCASASGDVGASMFSSPGVAALEKLPDLDLFVLTAVVMHDELDTDSVAEVLNAPLGKVQEACRHLEGLDVLAGARDGSGWSVDPAWWPAVLRLLRQKHFLYMG